MSAINTNNSYSQSPLPNQNFTDPSASKKLYLGPAGNSLPGITNLFFAPCEFVDTIKAVGKAKKIKDYQGIFEHSLRAASAPMRFLNALGSAAWYVLQGGVFFKVIAESLINSLTPLSLTVGGLGLVICAIDGALETWGLVKAKQFYTENYTNEENVYLTKLQRLQHKYLQVSPQRLSEIEAYVQDKFPDLTPAQQQEKKDAFVNAKLNGKFNNLVRRVQPWLAEEIKQTVPAILQELPSSDAAKQKAADIFQKIKMQSMKKFLIHSVGLAAALITAVGLILSLVACPFFVPLIFVILGMGLALSRYFLNAGLIDSKDWRFDLLNCLPSIFKPKPAPKIEIEPSSLGLKLCFRPQPKTKLNFRMA